MLVSAGWPAPRKTPALDVSCLLQGIGHLSQFFGDSLIALVGHRESDGKSDRIEGVFCVQLFEKPSTDCYFHPPTACFHVCEAAQPKRSTFVPATKIQSRCSQNGY